MSEKVELFFSFRSPYSYLAGPRAFRLPSRFDIEIEFRGVPPMVTRGVSLSRAKMFYLVSDAAREAKRLGMPFGKMFDTIGAGAMRCLKISELAKSVGLIEPFVINTTRGIWSQALDVVSDDELRRVCEGVGLDWSECVAALDDEAISAVLEANRQRLTELGQWGVPTFAWRGEVFWGQDRIVDLESALTQAGLQRS